ncbi:MAG: LamG domain-containing protein [Sedimentisphaerales bacterium]|nr:LamG domain-containing protein [Sedimentisphaerales bacterium]
MKKGTWWMVMVLLALLSQAQAALVITNGDFELWTSGVPDGWSKGGPVTLAESNLLNGTSSVRLTSVSNNQSSTYFFRQGFTPISAYFYVTFDFAFEDAPTGRDINFNLQNNTSTATSSVFNLRYEGTSIAIFNGSSWITLDSTGLLAASNFDSGIINPYRMIIEGTWRGTYSLKIIDLKTDAVIFDKSDLSHYQSAAAASFNAINFDLSRGANRILVDNLAVYSSNPFAPVVETGANTTLILPQNSLVMQPVVTNTDTPAANLIVQWTQISGPAVSFGTEAGETEHDLNARVNFVGGRGEYVLKVSVTDAYNYTGEDTMNIRVKDSAVDDVLLGWWGFEDMPQATLAADMLDAAAGNTAADNGYLAALADPNTIPGWVAGWVGNGALEFLGNGIVDVNEVTAQDPNVQGLRWEMTAAGWVKADMLSGGYRTLIGRTAPFNWILRKTENANTAEFVLQGDTGQVWVTGKTNILDGYWHHLAGTFDGQRAVLYVDGIEDAAVETQELIHYSAASKLSIGGRRDASHSLDGLADDVRLYSYALTPGALAGLVQQGINAIPRVTIDPDIPTELIKQFNNTVTLDADIEDLNAEDTLTAVWTVTNPEQADFVSFGNPNAVQTTATFSQEGVYTLRLAVHDGLAGLEGDIYDEIAITVNEPVCGDLLIYNEVVGRYLNPMMTSDIGGPAGKPDCYVNIYDLSVLAAEWLQCNDPEGEGCSL